MKFCANCGAKLEDDTLFCGECGSKVEDLVNSNENTSSATTSSPVSSDETTILSQDNIPDSLKNNNGPMNNGPMNNGPMNNGPMNNGPMNNGPMNNGPMNNGPMNNGPAKPSFVDTLKKIDKKIYAGIGAAVVALIVIFIVVSNMKKRVNLNDYVTVKYDGYNTVGTAKCTFDNEKFELDVLKKKGYKISSLDDIDNLSVSKQAKAAKILYNLTFSTDIDCSLDKTKSLSNGDKINLEIKYDKNDAKDLGLTFVAKSKEYTVADLKDSESINPFDYIDVTFNGTAPNVSVKITKKDTANSFIKSLSFNVSKSSGIAIGDKITVSVNNGDPETTTKSGYILSETKKEYTCDKADEYITDIKKLSDNQLKDLQKVATDKIEAYFAGFDSSYNVKCANLKYEGSYVLTRKQSSSSNSVYLVYSATVSSSDKGSTKGIPETTVYLPVKIDGVISKADGKIKYDSYTSIVGNTKLSVGWSSINGFTDGSEMYKEIVTKNKDTCNAQVEGSITQFGK